MPEVLRLARRRVQPELTMKRFLLFAFDTYYPSGGWSDFVGAFDTIEAVDEWIGHADYENFQYGNFQIVDSTTMEVLKHITK